jgi:hypothetical protein
MVFEHNCGQSGCDHEPAQPDSSTFSLYTKIDVANIQCLNEDRDGSGQTVFRPWDDKLNRCYQVKSDIDQDLLFNIPFNCSVKLKSIVVIGPNDDSHPYSIKIFKNKPFITFENVVGIDCDQALNLAKDADGIIAYPLKPVKFSGVNHLSIYVERNYSNDDSIQTNIYYIGLNGEFQAENRHQIVITNYESKANPADHKAVDNNTIYHDIF